MKGWISHIRNCLWTGIGETGAPDTSDCHLCSWVWWTGFSAATLQWPPLRQKGQWATTIPHRCVIHTSSLHHRASGDSRLCLCSDFWVGLGLERHPVPPCCPPALCPCRGVACASAPQAHICYMFPSGISKGPQRIPRILDTGFPEGHQSLDQRHKYVPHVFLLQPLK